MANAMRSTICGNRSSSGISARLTVVRKSKWSMRFLTFAELFFAAAIASRAQGPVLVVQPSAIMQTVAGTGTEGLSGDSGPATSAKIASPTAIVTDEAGNLYFSDRDNHCVRKIDTSGKITTVAGTGLEGFSGDG